jgi:hypothetical protein
MLAWKYALITGGLGTMIAALCISHLRSVSRKVVPAIARDAGRS